MGGSAKALRQTHLLTEEERDQLPWRVIQANIPYQPEDVDVFSFTDIQKNLSLLICYPKADENECIVVFKLTGSPEEGFSVAPINEKDEMEMASVTEAARQAKVSMDRIEGRPDPMPAKVKYKLFEKPVNVIIESREQL